MQSRSAAKTLVTLQKVPTLRSLYEGGVIRRDAERQRFEPVSAYLDRVCLFQGDITTLEVDSIVNAANRSLLGGGGVDGAIHEAAGRQLLEECIGLGGCETGDAKITKGYNLPSKHVIHTVGPVYSARQAKQKAELLVSCYNRSLSVAVENKLKHIAFPAISTSIYGYPIVDATEIALTVTRNFLESDKGDSLDKIIFTVFTDEDRTVYEELLPEFFPAVQETKQSDIEQAD